MNVFQMERITDENERSESSRVEAESHETDFSDFLQIRDHLKSLEFGWMKFYQFKNAVFSPGFRYPADADGKRRAQGLTHVGGVTDKKNIIFDFSENIDSTLKDKGGLLALSKLNKKFYFSYE